MAILLGYVSPAGGSTIGDLNQRYDKMEPNQVEFFGYVMSSSE